MEKPVHAVKRMQTPAARHFDHTQREWAAKPETAPAWAVNGSRVIGSSNPVNCEECEDYSQMFGNAMTVWQAEFDQWQAWDREQKKEQKGQELSTLLEEFEE